MEGWLGQAVEERHEAASSLSRMRMSGRCVRTLSESRRVQTQEFEVIKK